MKQRTERKNHSREHGADSAKESGGLDAGCGDDQRGRYRCAAAAVFTHLQPSARLACPVRTARSGGGGAMSGSPSPCKPKRAVSQSAHAAELRIWFEVVTRATLRVLKPCIRAARAAPAYVVLCPRFGIRRAHSNYGLGLPPVLQAVADVITTSCRPVPAPHPTAVLSPSTVTRSSHSSRVIRPSTPSAVLALRAPGP